VQASRVEGAPKLVRLVTPVNLNPPAAPPARPKGIGRGVAGQPRAAETCEIIPLPPVPTSPAQLLISPAGARLHQDRKSMS
jgi:hypothetical protein